MTMKQLHEELFRILCAIDDICREEGIRYFLDGGTAIGAVREHDFIAWDDDADIKVLRRDYPAFREAMRKHLPEHHLRFVEPQELAPGFFDFVSRVIDEQLPMRPDTDEDRYYHCLQNRIGVDVFLIDRVPASAMGRSLLRLANKVIYGMAMSRRYQVRSEKYSPLQKLQVAVLRLMGRPFSVEQLLRMWEGVNRHWQNRETGWCFCSSYPLQFFCFFPERIFRDVALMEMHGRLFPVSIGYDEELTIIFGDYMTPVHDETLYITHVAVDE